MMQYMYSSPNPEVSIRPGLSKEELLYNIKKAENCLLSWIDIGVAITGYWYIHVPSRCVDKGIGVAMMYQICFLPRSSASVRLIKPFVQWKLRVD
jgi:hypothetical protein